MSDGSPVGGGHMRQRHSQGYASSGDDLEDDASSRPRAASPQIPRVRTWVEVAENAIWVASALFIIYYGDRHFNLIYLLFHDGRIRRIPLYLGMIGIFLNIVIVTYTSLSKWSPKIFDDKWELTSLSTLPFVTLVGIISFCLLSFALWPIFSFLTIPLLFSLFMACVVVLPNTVIGNFRQQFDAFRTE